MLTLDTEAMWAVKSEKPLQEIVTLFKECADVDFYPSDIWSHGYPTYRGQAGEYQLWLSPNEVPLAFARKGEKNFNQLKNYEGKTAIRFPEINAKYTLINSYDERLIPILTEKLNGILEIAKLSDILNE